MFCPNCGETLEDGARACTACGADLSDRVGARSPSQNPARRRPRWLVAVAAALLVALVVGGVSLFVFAGSGPGTNGMESGTTNGGDDAGDSALSPAPPETEPGDETWTVLIYLCGTNLESDMALATENLLELESLDLSDRVNVLVETGGARTWHNDLSHSDRLERYEVGDGKTTLVDHEESASMGDPTTLADFIAWGSKNYAADHYVLVFWDHGGGSIVGVCQDELFDDSMLLPEIKAALDSGGVHFDIVGFDTCLMATLETAQMLEPYADYMVASEEIIPAGGWAYAEWPAWFDGTSNDAASLGMEICNTYMQKCAVTGVGDTATLSVVDLAAIQPVAQAFDEAAKGMASSTDDAIRMQTIIKDGRDAEFFGYASYLEGYTDMVDLLDLVTCMRESLPDEAAALDKAVSEAVVYELHGSSRSHATGISVFYPLLMTEDVYTAYSYVSNMLELDNDNYLQYLSVRAGVYDPDDWKDKDVQRIDPVSADDVRITYKSLIDKDGRYRVQITGGTQWVTGATFTLALVLDDGSVATLGTDNNLDLLLGKDVAQIDYIDRFEGGWLWIGDKCVHAEIVEMVAENDAPSYNLYSIPVELTTSRTASGKEITIETNLLVRYNYKDNSYEAQCVYDNIDESGMAGKTAVSLAAGDKLKFLAARVVDGKVQTGNTGTITWTDDTEVHMRYAGDGTYLYQVNITDIFGKTYTPKEALITLEGGRRTKAELV